MGDEGHYTGQGFQDAFHAPPHDHSIFTFSANDPSSSQDGAQPSQDHNVGIRMFDNVMPVPSVALPQTVLSSYNLQNSPGPANAYATLPYTDVTQQTLNFPGQNIRLGKSQQPVTPFAATQGPSPLPVDPRQNHLSPTWQAWAQHPPAPQTQHGHNGQTQNFMPRKSASDAQVMSSGTFFTSPMIVQGAVHHSQQSRNWDLNFDNKILCVIAQEVAPKLNLELRTRFDPKKLTELDEPFLRMLWRFMQIDRGEHPPELPSLTLPSGLSSANSIGGKDSGEYHHGAAGMGFGNGEELMGATAHCRYTYEGAYLEELQQDAKSRRKAKCHCQPRESANTTSAYLPCLKADCDAWFNTKLSWIRHTWQTIVEHTWLCPMCLDERHTRRIFDRVDQYEQHVHGHLRPHSDAEQRAAVEKAVKYLAYTPPFWDFCRICSERFNQFSRWSKHVHDHFHHAMDDQRLKLKKKWTESYPPPIPDDTCGPSANLCHVVDESAKEDQAADTVGKQDATPSRTPSKRSGCQSLRSTTPQRGKRSKTYQRNQHNQRGDGVIDMQSPRINSSVGEAPARDRPHGVSLDNSFRDLGSWT